MRFEPNEDQAAFLAVVDQLTASPQAAWKAAAGWARHDWSAELDARLDEGGYFECAREATLGPATAAAMTYRLAQLPALVECAASSMLRPLLDVPVPRPLAVIEPEAAAVRFLPVAASVLRFGPSGVELASLERGAMPPVDSLFAYPMGLLPARALDWRPVEADPARLLDAWRVAVAAEITGALKGGLDAVVAHVRHRRQFGRPLGSFQTIQHRLAGALTRIEGALWLALKAAQTARPADAALALGHVQGLSTTVVYDLHQFMGAMGLTLEHPLHRWTYRVRLLRSSLGGASANLAAAASSTWRTA